MRIGKGNRSTRRKLAPVPLGPPHVLTWARTRAAAVGSRRLTTYAMARPVRPLTSRVREVTVVTITAATTKQQQTTGFEKIIWFSLIYTLVYTCRPVGATALGEPWLPLQPVPTVRFLNKIIFLKDGVVCPMPNPHPWPRHSSGR
jgi:hypothetical protein